VVAGLGGGIENRSSPGVGETVSREQGKKCKDKNQ
jgi:hypothetical protein